MTGKTEPRLWTRPLAELTETNTLGFACIEYATTVLRKMLYPWQEWALIHSLEIVGDLETGWHFRYRVVLFLISRQNGKTVLSEVLASFFLNVLMVQNIFGTSLSLEKAEEVWEAVIRDQEDYPELSGDITRISRTNGKKRLELSGGRRYKVGAPSRRAGRGDSNDLVMLDEIREHRDWETWSAAAASTNAKPNGLIVCFSNAGDPDSIVLRQLRAQALGQKTNFGGGEIDATTLALFEWSAKEGAAMDDEEELAQANPAMGYGLLTLRALLANRETFPEAKFRSECMCQQVETILPPPFPDGAWAESIDRESFIAADAPVFYGIDLSQDRRWTAIGACGQREDGNWHIEVVARRIGTEWALDWFRERSVKGRMRLAFQSRGAPVSGLAEQICTIPGVERIAIEGADLSNGWGRFYDGICASLPDREGVRIFHLPQPIMDAPGKTMQLKSMGGGIRLPDRLKSPDDIAPLFACVMAFAAASKPADTSKKIYESAYENGSSLTFI